LKITASLALALFSAWMVLKIRFRTLKFYLKNYVSRGQKEKKERLRKHLTSYAEKGTECQPFLRSREFRESFVKIVT